jgi:hypothetical protein
MGIDKLDIKEPVSTHDAGDRRTIGIVNCPQSKNVSFKTIRDVYELSFDRRVQSNL